MNRILLGIAAAGLTISGAFAADDLMAVYFGNTLTATDAAGTTKILYGTDHSWTASGPRGASNGTWEVKNGTSLRHATRSASARQHAGPRLRDH